MKKKYEKPEMIVEVMSMDMLQMACSHKANLPSSRSATHPPCNCCVLGTNYPVNSHF